MSDKQERKGLYSREEVVAILKDFQEKNNQAVAKSIGNGAKMREALEAVLCNWTEDGFGFIKKTTIEAVKQALAAPPRNCDVGTSSEQYGRFLAYCKRRNACADCPVWKLWDLLGDKNEACHFIWAQMPYEEGGEG